jgi:hypothetical protein
MSELHDLHDLHDLLANEANRGAAVSGPPFETLVARSRRRRVTQLVTVAGVVLVVTAAVVVPSVVGHHRTAVVAVGPSGVGGSGGATTQAARIAVTQQAADELVAGVQLPAGAVASPSAPTQALAEAQGSPGSKNLVDATRFYTVPGTIDAVLAYVKAHPPTGTYADGTSSSSGSDGVELEGIMFGRIATHDYAAPVLWVMATKLGTGVAVRIDAYLVWRPLRTVAEYAPVNATKATACYGGLDCPPAVLGSQDARELAAFFNSLDTQTPTDNYGGCESGQLFNGASHITFDGSGRSVTFSPTCGGITVTANGVAQPTLDTTDVAMDPELQHLLGLSNAPSGSSPAPVGSGFSPTVSVASAVASAAASSGPS